MLVSVSLLSVEPLLAARADALLRQNIPFGKVETLHVFPTEVHSTSWSNIEQAAVQDLSEYSIYQEFNDSNAASLLVDDPVVSTPVKEVGHPKPAGGSLVTDANSSLNSVQASSTTSSPQATTSAPVPEEFPNTPGSTTESLPVKINNLEEDVAQEDVQVEFEPESTEETEPVIEEAEVSEDAEPSADQTQSAESEAAPVTNSAETNEPTASLIQSAGKFVKGVFAKVTQSFPFAVDTIISTTTPINEADTELPAVSTEATGSTSMSAVSDSSADAELLPAVATSTVVQEEDLAADTTDTASTTDAEVEDTPQPHTPSPSVDQITSTTTNDTEVENESYEITFSDFGIEGLASGQLVTNTQLRISLAGTVLGVSSSSAPVLEVLYGVPGELQMVGSIVLNEEISNALNGGYFLFALPQNQVVKKMKDTKVVVQYVGDRDVLEGLYIDAVWLEVDTKVITAKDIEKRGVATQLRHLAMPKVTELVSERLNFTRKELPVFNLRYSSQRNALVRGFRSLIGRQLAAVESVSVVHKGLGPLGIKPEITTTDDGLITLAFSKEALQKLRPGEYEVTLRIDEGGVETTDSFNFQWGILAMNPNQTEYASGATAEISIGALTPNGHTICKANLDLYVTNPEGFITKVDVQESGQCDGNNIVDVPDFSALVSTEVPGEYSLYLERLDDEGNVLGFTSDSFYVVAEQLVALKRVGPSRIYPPAPYPMTLTVSPTRSFEGTLTERVPEDFVVSSTSADITIVDGWQELTWALDIQAGESVAVSYTFDAPDLSPYLYNLGPARLQSETFDAVLTPQPATSSQAVSSTSTASTTANVASSTDNQIADRTFAFSFIEHRAWQIASDAVGNIILFWDDGASIPTGWTCLSCGSGTFFQRFVMGSSTYNSTGGTANHTHTFSTSLLQNLSATVESGSGGPAVNTHSHTLTPSITTVTNLPEYRQLRVIQYTDAAGEPTTIPQGAIAIFDVASSSLPSGWNRYTPQDGRYVYGEDTPGTTGGSNEHAHTISGTTGGSTGGTARNRGGGVQTTAAVDGHTHTISTSTDTINNEPPYIEVLLAKASTDLSPGNNMIAMWTEEVDNGWIDVSSNPGDPFSNRFIKPAATYGATGGGSSHAHANISNAQTSVPSATTNGRTGSSGSSPTHQHNVNFTSFSSAETLPPYLTAVFGKRQGTNPVYEQLSSHWYVNLDNQTPSDPWPSGGADLAEGAPVTATSTPVKSGDEIRLRVNVGVSNATSTAGLAFKLQYATTTTTCSAPENWLSVGNSASTTLWRGYDNPGVTDHSLLSTRLLASSTVSATYAESGYATNTPDINVDEYAEWDFVLEHNGAAAGTNHCFRLVENDGDPFLNYTHYPQLYTNEAPSIPTLNKLFDNEKTASTSPFFQFVASDTEGEKIHYEIEVDDDYAFGSPDIDRNTINDSSLFENQVLASDKAPFINGNVIEFRPSETLINGTTYYWRVRGQDPDGSATWGEWSNIRSFTIDTSLNATAWFQTADEQFDTNTLAGVETGSDQITLQTGSPNGTTTSTAIDFDDGGLGTAWDNLSFTDVGSITYYVEYLDDTWLRIPDSDLSGNSSGFTSSPVNLLTLDTDTYNQIRIVAAFNNTVTPALSDWTINWGYRVETPTITKTFPNEQVGTTSPTFEFSTTDPQDDSLTYQVQISEQFDFSTPTTYTSGASSTFTNIDNGVDVDPFNSGDTIQFVPSVTLNGTTTYWWRVRAKDTTGADAYSFWTNPRSFTVIPGTDVSTWYQTTEEQFDTDILSGTQALASGAVSVATTASEAILIYGEGTDTTPRYRQWNGSNWSAEGSMLDVGAPIKWAVVKAGITREEYVAATVGTDNDINVQVFSTGAWDDLQEVTASMGDINARGFDVAYENVSGDAMVAYCDGDADPSYYIWNGTSWTLGGAINLSSGNNCEWIQLASDPASDEIIILSRDDAGSSYEAQVWDGDAWGDSTTLGNISDADHEGMAVEYEESGDQAVILSSDGNPARFRWNTWNGATWGSAATLGLGDDLEWAELVRDDGTDEMVLCYQDEDTDMGVVQWTGAGWTGQTELVVGANAKNDPGFGCVYETATTRDNFVLATHSNTTQTTYSTWNNSTWSGTTQINTMGDTATVDLTRTGAGAILGLFFDDPNDSLLFANWNGSAWSSTQTLENDMSVDTTPFGQPYNMAPRNSGRDGTTIVSPGIEFNDGLGPYWQEFSWVDTTPGTSDILYQVQYQTATGSWAFIPDVDLPNNSTGTSTSPIDLSSLNKDTYNIIRPFATLSCDESLNCPSINDWSVTWAGGITISGTIDQYDESTDVNSGTVAVAVNGVVQTGKTGSISGGAWSINNVTTFAGDVVTVFVTGAADANEAVGVTRYDGSGDVTGMQLYERHLTLGSNDATSTPLTNADIGGYDFTNTEDIFVDVDGSDLTACADTGCGDVKVFVKAGTAYSPGGRVVTHDFVNNGTFTAGANTIEVNGSWDNNATTTMTNSTVVLAATSSVESIDSTGANTASFYNLTFGTTTGSGTWTLLSPLDVNNDLIVSRGTLVRGNTAIAVAGDLSTGANGTWSGQGTTTFDGVSSGIWSDQNATLQNVGKVVVDGTNKIVVLGSNVAAESIYIGANDTLDASNANYTLTVYGGWVNNNNFLPRLGTVLFAATSSGSTITTAGDAFYNLSFSGVGGDWSFTESALTVSNDFTVSTGTVTMPTGTTTIAGSFDATGGQFAHNNGTLNFTSASSETLTFDGSGFTNTTYNVTFNGGGSWNFSDNYATTSNDVRITQGAVMFPDGQYAVGGTIVDSGGSFTGNNGTVRFYSSASESITVGGSTFSSVAFEGTGDWSFTDTNVTASGDLTIGSGTLTLPSGTFTIGGSYQNQGTVTAGTGAVTFNSADSGETIDFGSSSLYDVNFNSATGGWTITASATTTNNFALGTSSDFTLASGQVLSVGGEFTNYVGGASTTWTGSTIRLEAGNYSINNKNSAGDTYANLFLTSNTDIAMWNSVATTYQVGSGGSLYSQDHNAIDGSLYIFGEYERSSGTEHWSYGTDFDGTDLGGSERQAHVRFASGASASFTNSTLSIIGSSTASTTIANQGSGVYTMSVSGGTTTAQYYEFSDLGSSGISLLGSTTVTTLNNGSFAPAVAAGTGLTLSSTTIDANPAKQIFNVRFATTSAISAFNVAQTDGAPTSFWWFRDGVGNLYGEAYDNDTGDPGSVRFDDSSLVITVSGTVYSDGGSTPLTDNLTCDDSTNVIRVVVNGGTSYDGSCSSADGSYSIPGVVVIGDPTLTVFLNDAPGSHYGSVVTRTPTSDIGNLDIYVNRVIVRHEDTSPLTIANLARYDEDNDSDLRFNAATSTTPDTLTLRAENELHIFASSTFTPGGPITLNANASANNYDGTLYLAGDATFNSHQTATNTIGGGVTLASGATINAASSTILFTATTTGKSITAVSPVTLHSVTFDGTGGGWSMGADISAQADVNITAGTVSGTGNLTLSNGSLTGNGVLTLTGGTVTLEKTNTLGGTSAWTFNNLTLGSGSDVGTTTPAFTGTTTVSGTFTIANAHFFDAGSTNWNLAGSGGVFIETGTFLEDSSTIRYSGNGADVLNTQYHNLTLEASAGSATYTAVGAGLIVDNDLVIGGTAGSVFDLTTNDPSLDVNGNVHIKSNGTLQASDSSALTIAGSYTNDGTLINNGGTITFDGAGNSNISAGTASFGNVVIDGAGSFTFTRSATSTGNFTLTNHSNFTLNSSETLAVGGTFTNSQGGAATTWTGSTLRLFSNTSFSANTKAVSDSYGTLVIAGTTQMRLWNSDASTYDVSSTASLYSQDHAGVDGDLYIFGSYQNASGNDFWSYARDFDGTVLGGGSRVVDVYFATSASATIVGGSLDVQGAVGATTTIQSQSDQTYDVRIGGSASTTWRRYAIRDIGSNGLVFSGAPSITTLSLGDYEVSQNGGSAITVGGGVITANPAKTFNNNRFTLNGVGSGLNVTATGTANSSWRFANHTGDIDGEAFDSDPDGDPGYIAWDDSAALITISGNIYSDEGSTVSSICDGSTNNIALYVQGNPVGNTSCNGTTGAYNFSNVAYSTTDSLIVYIDGESQTGAVVTEDPVSNINNLDVYENRVIVRHENVDPLSISDMALWDSSDDVDVPFTAVDAAVDVLTLPADTKLLIWNSKEFEPNGNVTLSGAGAGAAYDGTLELKANAIWTGQGTEELSIGGSLLLDTSATFEAANGTTTFTTTGASRTIDVNEHDFNNVRFTGSGSWIISDATLSIVGDFTQTGGSLTLPSGTTTAQGSFINSGGTFNANGGVLTLSGTGNHTVAANGSSFAGVRFTGSGTFTMSDTNATATASVLIIDGSVTLPSGVFAIGADFKNIGGSFTHNTSELVFTSTTTSTVLASSSDLHALTFNGGGAYALADESLSLMDSLTIHAGSLSLATGTLSIGGSFLVTGGSFDHSSGTILFNSSDGGETINPGASDFYNVQFAGGSGGWTMSADATTTNNFILLNAGSFVLGSGNTLTVEGVFQNSVGGAATTWSGSTIRLTGGLSYEISPKTIGAEEYHELIIGSNSDISTWNSSSTINTVAPSASLYSQDHNGIDGALYIFGDYHISTTTEYWSYATDFDGTDLSGGSERAVTVSLAQNATTSVDGGTLNIIGTSGNETTITNQGAGTYSFNVSDGTFNAQHYAYRNLNSLGLNLINQPTISSLSNGDFELAVDAGTLISISSTTLNANASRIITGARFATTTAISGKNVTLSGTTNSAWTFVGSSGNLEGEAFDVDGATACGQLRWDDSVCQLTQQTHYRWRNDDGVLGVPADEWFNTNWDARKRVRIENNDNTTYTNAAIELTVSYDTDMQADFGDLRFTDSSGTTTIPHWFGSTTDGVVAEVWVKVPNLPAQDTATVFMYYNHPTASSSTSISDTFIAADDFEDGDISEYSGETGDFVVDGTFAHNGSYGLDATGNELGRTESGGIYDIGQTVSQGETLRYQLYVDSAEADEVCTMFGIQSTGVPSSNYAVCTDLNGVDRLVLVRDVDDSADSAAAELDSSAVTYSTGWYEIEVDWGTDNSITVYLYNEAGTLVTTLSASDSNYTTGGIGFTYWFQHGGWDSYTSRPLLSSEPTVRFGAEQSDGGATWAGALDTVTTAFGSGDVARLRVAVENSGLAISNQQFLLEYAEQGGSPSCESVSASSYAAVPIQASCGTSPVCMQTTSNYTNGAVTTDLLFGTEGEFVSGEAREDPSNITSGLNVGQNEYVELEYAVTPTIHVSDPNLCFRVTDNGSDYDTYLSVAKMNVQFSPTFGAVSFNGGSNISLTPGTTTTVYATATVTDLNGYADIVLGSSTMYTTGAGAACNADNNDCYITNTNTQCSFENCSGNSCVLECYADLQFHANPTDFSGEDWFAFLEAEDSSGGYGFNSSAGVDLLTMRALNVANALNYGTLAPNDDTGSDNASTSIYNIGNESIDVQVSGIDLTDGAASTIDVSQQRFATSTFTYNSCTICTTLNSSGVNVEVDLAKPVTGSPLPEDKIYWGIAVPIGTASNAHSGNNLFTAISDD